MSRALTRRSSPRFMPGGGGPANALSMRGVAQLSRPERSVSTCRALTGRRQGKHRRAIGSLLPIELGSLRPKRPGDPRATHRGGDHRPSAFPGGRPHHPQNLGASDIWEFLTPKSRTHDRAARGNQSQRQYNVLVPKPPSKEINPYRPPRFVPGGPILSHLSSNHKTAPSKAVIVIEIRSPRLPAFNHSRTDDCIPEERARFSCWRLVAGNCQ